MGDRYVLVVEPIRHRADPDPVPVTVRLRRLLRAARRSFGLRVISVERVDLEEIR